MVPYAAASAVCVVAISVFGALLCRPSAVGWLHSLLSVRQEGGELPHADVIIVLGYALFKSGEPTEPLKGRIVAGVQAYQQGMASRVILSGAHPGDCLRCVSEASAMALYASSLLGRDINDQPERWLMEEASTSTRENALFSLKMVQEHKWTSVLVVTSPFHQLRSLWTFQRAARDLGVQPLQVYIAPVPFVGHKGYGPPVFDAAVDLWDWVRELLAFAWYWAKGYL